MKIDLAVWTAVNGYDWQPGSVYSQKELVGYKDAIGPLEQYSLPLGGLFLKDGKAVFYRVQIAERMDSRGRGAIYLVLGTVPVERAAEVDFSEIFNSPEMAKPQKPFPTVIEHDAKPRECKASLGREGFTERRFTGAETFADLGGWCAEAKVGKLNVCITGTMESPLFTVAYAPCAIPARKEPTQPQERPIPSPTPEYGDNASGGMTRRHDDAVRLPHREEGRRKGELDKSSFALGFIMGFIIALLVFLVAVVLFGCGRTQGKPRSRERSKTEVHVHGSKSAAGDNGDDKERQ